MEINGSLPVMEMKQEAAMVPLQRKIQTLPLRKDDEEKEAPFVPVKGTGPGTFDEHLIKVQKGFKRKTPDQHRKELRDAAHELESMMVFQMLKTMRSSIPKSELFHGGHAEDVFRSMLDEEYALTVSRNGNLGLADQMYNELSRSLPQK